MSNREHVLSHYPGTLMPCWCEPGVYHCTAEDWEASRPEREMFQAAMDDLGAMIDRLALPAPSVEARDDH